MRLVIEREIHLIYLLRVFQIIRPISCLLREHHLPVGNNVIIVK
jgi:hypothetical protein